MGSFIYIGYYLEPLKTFTVRKPSRTCLYSAAFTSEINIPNTVIAETNCHVKNKTVSSVDWFEYWWVLKCSWAFFGSGNVWNAWN